MSVCITEQCGVLWLKGGRAAKSRASLGSPIQLSMYTLRILHTIYMVFLEQRFKKNGTGRHRGTQPIRSERGVGQESTAERAGEKGPGASNERWQETPVPEAPWLFKVFQFFFQARHTLTTTRTVDHPFRWLDRSHEMAGNHPLSEFLSCEGINFKKHLFTMSSTVIETYMGCPNKLVRFYPVDCADKEAEPQSNHTI